MNASHPDHRMTKVCYKMLKNVDENGRKTLGNDIKLLLENVRIFR